MADWDVESHQVDTLHAKIARLNIELEQLLGQLLVAEQALDTAHAALEAIIYASDGCQGHANCNHTMEPWKNARKLLGLDAALAASAPQKPKCNCYPWEGVHAVDCPTRLAPAQETER